MAEQNCSSPSSPTPIIITTAASDPVKSDVDDSNSLPSSCETRNFTDKNYLSSDEDASSNNSQPSSYQPKQKSLFSDPLIPGGTSEKRNGVKDDESSAGKSTSFLRPSILSGGFASFTAKSADATKSSSPFSLNCPKLNLGSSKFGDGSFATSTETSAPAPGSSLPAPAPKSAEPEKVLEPEAGDGKTAKPSLAGFTSIFNPSSSPLVSASPKTSVMSVPNFVFGQNLHERVTDSVKTGNVASTPSGTEVKSNGTSEMLFTSVLTSQEARDKDKDGSSGGNADSFGSSKDTSSLIEDAARCQEARASKRKYEEVLVTTGEEDEENVLQVNVKLFAFDNGAWLERGRGILRLNDKKSDEGTTSRIVIRAVGNLRVVLNTKIWNKMSLSRASERSARLTAIDPNGQVKIYLIQSSVKDMTSLYSLLEERIKTCQEQNLEPEASPEKKIALDKSEEA